MRNYRVDVSDIGSKGEPKAVEPTFIGRISFLEAIVLVLVYDTTLSSFVMKISVGSYTKVQKSK